MTPPRHFGVRSGPTEDAYSTKELPLPRFLMLSPLRAGRLRFVPFSSSAQAQFGVEIGPRGPRLYEEQEPRHATLNVGAASSRRTMTTAAGSFDDIQTASVRGWSDANAFAIRSAR